MTRRKRLTKIEKEFNDTARKKIRTKRKPKPIDPSTLVPTGSTTFNVECSSKIEGAFKVGKMVNIIGDSHAGKTLFCLTILAECSMLKHFDNYRFIFDDVEAANEFDLVYLFGKKMADRVEHSITSNTIEDFNDNLARAMLDKRPFIYIVDSWDALTSESAIELDIVNRGKREKGNKIKGSYGDGKAKKASEMFAQRIQDLKKSDSLVIVISQTRDNIGFGAMFAPKTRSGGKALRFYASHEVWLATQKKDTEGSAKRRVSSQVQAKITKNKLTGRHSEAFFPILFDYGVDNITSCINFLIDEGSWSGAKASVNTKGFTEENMSRLDLISHIEENDLEDALFEVVQREYDSIMENLKPKRKQKYS